MQNSWNYNVGKSSLLKKWQTMVIIWKISYILFFLVFWVAIHGRLDYMIIQYKKSCPQQMCLPRKSLIFRVYLGVRTCEVFLCFAPFVFLGFIVLTSLCPLPYVTREFHRFFHRQWADPIFLDKLEREATGAVACSKCSDSGERCEVKKAMKSRGGLGREVRERV